jgi:hypothetical protein
MERTVEGAIRWKRQYHQHGFTISTNGLTPGEVSNGNAISTLRHSEPLEKPGILQVFQLSEEAIEIADPSNIVSLLKVAGPAEEGREALIFTVQFGSQVA